MKIPAPIASGPPRPAGAPLAPLLPPLPLLLYPGGAPAPLPPLLLPPGGGPSPLGGPAVGPPPLLFHGLEPVHKKG